MSENEQENKKTAASNLDIKLWAFGSVLFILMSVFGYLGYLNLHFPPTELENYAMLGDSFGILSSLFSGLAFAGLIVTIVMQNKTLKAQMEELELARKEYKRQGDALHAQQKIMDEQFKAAQLQSFESTLYKLLEFKQQSLKNKIEDKNISLEIAIKERFSDGVVITRSCADIFKSGSFKLYFRKVVGIFDFISKDINGDSYVFFKELCLDFFSKEEMKSIFWFLEKGKSIGFRKYFFIIHDLNIDVEELFINNFSEIKEAEAVDYCRYLKNKINSDDFDFYENIWERHDDVIFVVEFIFLELNPSLIKIDSFVSFLNIYVDALKKNIVFSSFIFDEDVNNTSSELRFVYECRINDITEKILSLTPPAS